MEYPEFLLIKKPLNNFKQFLQPMIEQVWGRGGCAGRMCCCFASVFQSYCICVGFSSIHRCLFWTGFTSISIIFAVDSVSFIKTSSSVLGTKFSRCTIDPKFLKISSLSLILQFLEGIIGNKLPNKWILIQQ